MTLTRHAADLVLDGRYALRAVRKDLRLFAFAVLIVGLGVGACTAVYSILDPLLLGDLPFEEPERLVALHAFQPALSESRISVSAPDYHDWTHDNPVFAEAGAYYWKDYNFQSLDEPVRLAGCAVSAGLFPLLGVEPFMGRNFLAEEDQPGGPLVAMISYDVWRQRLAGDPQVVGKTLRLDGEVHEIVGVMPKGFHFSHYGEIWTPLQVDVLSEPRDSDLLAVIARLRPGMDLEAAQGEMAAVGQRLASLYPETHAGWTVEVKSLREAWMPAAASAKLAMAAQMVLVAGVLLIVCANVVNVMLAQSTRRRHETSLRAALGASRGRLIRQTLVESTMLALAGGVVGALLAAQTDIAFKSMISVPLPYWLDFSLESHGLTYILGASLVAGLLIGLLPAIKSSGRNLLDALKDGGGLGDRSGHWLRRGLVVGEYAIALVILVSGLLMVQSFDHLRQNRGFATENVLTLKLPLTAAAYDDGTSRAQYMDEVLRRLEVLPEIAGVGATTVLPVNMDFGFPSTPLGVEGLSFDDGEEPRVLLRSVSSGFFDALSMTHLQGRTFTAEEVSSGADAVILNAALAERLWPGEDPLHRRVRALDGEPGPWLEVIGVVGDIEPSEMVPGMGAMTQHRLYLPLAGTASPSPIGSMPRTPALVVAGYVAPAALVPPVRRELRAIDPAVPLFEVLPMEEVLDRFYFAHQVWSRTFSAMALLALMIAAVGVYGVTSYSVSLRRREMGLRIALGADPRQLLTLVVGQGLVLATVGVGLGLAAAVPMAQAMETLLVDMQAIDPGVFGAVVGTLLGVGFLASVGPARLAAAADPIEALRSE